MNTDPPVRDRKSQGAIRIGLVSAIVLYVCFGLVHAFMLPIYRPGDERRHAKYVVVLESEGRLPTPRETWAASHPPLYYALVGKTVMRGAESTGGIETSVRGARVISVGFGAIALVFAFLIIRLLLPRHPAVAVHATAIIAIIPSYANISAVLANDSMSVAAQFAMVYAALLILLRGPSWPRCLQLALYLSIVGLTRVSGVLVIPVALLAVAWGVWWHVRGSRPHRAGRALLIVGALAASVALSSGWFYLRNASVSGDPTGQAAVFEQVRNHPVRSPLAVLFDPTKWLEIHDETWGRLAGLVNIKGALRHFARLLTVLSLAGAAYALWRARVWRWFRDWRTPRVFSWAIVVGVFWSVFLPVFAYHARGGGLHQRYTFGALFVVTLVLALGFTWSRRAVVPIAGYCAAFVLGYSLHVTYAARLVGKVKTFPIEQALRGFDHSEASTTWLLVALTLSLVGVVHALAELHRPLTAELDS